MTEPGLQPPPEELSSEASGRQLPVKIIGHDIPEYHPHGSFKYPVLPSPQPPVGRPEEITVQLLSLPFIMSEQYVLTLVVRPLRWLNP